MNISPPPAVAPLLQLYFDQFGVRERFTFGRFMDLAVVRLTRKPLRVLLTLHRLSAALDADAALSTLRDFFERSAKVSGPVRLVGAKAAPPLD